eukprot:7133310-Pyramimonas_sp.AAC.1
MLAAGKSGENGGRKWGTGQGGENRGRSAMGVECTLAVTGTGGPVKRSDVTGWSGMLRRMTNGQLSRDGIVSLSLQPNVSGGGGAAPRKTGRMCTR